MLSYSKLAFASSYNDSNPYYFSPFCLSMSSACYLAAIAFLYNAFRFLLSRFRTVEA